MSVERLYALLGIPPLNGLRRDFSDQQVIFPSIRFRCTGEVVKWILAGRWNSYNDSLFPELQVWRSSGNSTFEKQGSSVISVSQQEGGGVYEFPVAPPLQFQPGDILGIIQPSGGDSRLQISYDDGGHSPNYATVSDDNNEFFNVQGEAVTTLINIPLVTVKIG